MKNREEALQGLLTEVAALRAAYRARAEAAETAKKCDNEREYVLARVTAERDALRARAAALEDHDLLYDENDALKARVAELERFAKEDSEGKDRCLLVNNALRAENERLRGALVLASGAFGIGGPRSAAVHHSTCAFWTYRGPLPDEPCDCGTTEALLAVRSALSTPPQEPRK